MTILGTKWHTWTDEERDIIRRDFTGTKQSIRDIAEHLSLMSGGRFTEPMVAHQVSQMGLRARWGKTKEPEWTPDEDEYLRQGIERGIGPIRIGVHLGRTPTAVFVRAKRIGASRRARTGWYTKSEVAEILGVEHKRVQRWMDTGELKARPQYDVTPSQAGGGYWHIEENDLKDFIRSHSLELTGRNVDLFSIINILESAENPIADGPRLRIIGRYHDGKEVVWIWLVNGRAVRDHLYQDFTQGNHHFVAHCIPENEIWIDDANHAERWPIIQHEVHERNLMKFKHLSYSRAHERANRKEKQFRRNPLVEGESFRIANMIAKVLWQRHPPAEIFHILQHAVEYVRTVRLQERVKTTPVPDQYWPEVRHILQLLDGQQADPGEQLLILTIMRDTLVQAMTDQNPFGVAGTVVCPMCRQRVHVAPHETRSDALTEHIRDAHTYHRMLWKPWSWRQRHGSEQATHQ